MFATVLLAPLMLAAAPQAPTAAALPRPGEFQRHVLAVMRSYPTDGTHRYHWPRKGSWGGNTRDLHYLGELFAKGDPQGRGYCCGLTLEVFLRAWERWARTRKQPLAIPGIPDVAALRAFRGQWFGSDGNRKTLLNAVLAHKLGTHVERLEEARAGDFVQFWRHSGSGHSVIFIGWVRDSRKRIRGLKYWSTQKSTRGIGYRTETIGGDKGLIRDQIHIARIGRPRR